MRSVLLSMNWLKRTAAGFCALALGTAAVAQTVALPILPPDVRAQFSAVGRFGQAGFRTKQGCTATLIAPDLLITAAHCVSANGTSDRVFVAGWDRGDYLAFSGSAQEMRHPAFRLGGRDSPRNDVALVVLDTPITDVAPIRVSDTDFSALGTATLALVGYHTKTPHLLTGGLSCDSSAFGVGLIRVACPVVSGNSGSPLLREAASGGWELIGVVSSRNGGGSIGVELLPWLRRAIKEHQAQSN